MREFVVPTKEKPLIAKNLFNIKVEEERTFLSIFVVSYSSGHCNVSNYCDLWNWAYRKPPGEYVH